MIRFGLVTRTSGIEYGKSGSVSFDSTLDGGGPSIGASIYDGSATFEYKLPFEMDGGIALIGKRAEVEFDIKGYSSIGSYALLSSSETLTIYRDPGDKTGGSFENRPFPAIMTEFRGIVNYVGGGHVRILDKPFPLTVHAGFGTDFSPVTSADAAVFGQVDFMVYTIGISGSIGKFSWCARLELAPGQHRQPRPVEFDHGTGSGFAAGQDDRDHLRAQLQVLNETARLNPAWRIRPSLV